jgi:hypothetical protein
MNFKTPEIKERFDQCNDVIKFIINDIDDYCFSNFKEHVTVTEAKTTKGEDELRKRISTTHQDGRAADLRRSNLTDMQVVELVSHFNVKYSREAAFNREGAIRLIVPKSDHLHVQVRRMSDEEIKNFLEEQRS